MTEQVREFNEQIYFQETKDAQVIQDMVDNINKKQDEVGNTKEEKA